MGDTEPHRVVGGVDIDSDYIVGGIEEKQFLAIFAPAWRGAPVGRDLPLGASSGKCTDVNLIPSRLIGVISQPLAVGREDRSVLVKCSLDNGERLAVTK